MELKGKDSLRINVSDFLSMLEQKSLLSMYQPIMGANATLLYLTLVNEGNALQNILTHEYLCEIMNINILDLEKARKTLEEFKLVTTYYKHENNQDSYIYNLNKPLVPSEFIKNNNFVSLLVKVLEYKQFELLLSKVLDNVYNTNNYEDISKQMDYDDNSNRKVENLKLNIVKPKQGFTNAKDYEFDFDMFFKKITTLVFPIELRTNENLELIGKLGDLYGVSVDDMVIAVGKSVDIQTMTFNGGMLRSSVSRYMDDSINTEDVYLSNPLAFLKNKQNGIKVTNADKALLEYLAVDLKLKNEVINVLIEYVLKINNNSIPFKFVEKIAGEWVRENITTKKQAMDIASRSQAQRRSYVSKRVLPKYRQSEVEVTKTREQLLKELKEGLNHE